MKYSPQIAILLLTVIVVALLVMLLKRDYTPEQETINEEVVINTPQIKEPSEQEQMEAERLRIKEAMTIHKEEIKQERRIAAIVEKPEAFTPTRIISSVGVADSVYGFEGRTPIEIEMKGDTIYQIRILSNEESPEHMDILYNGDLDKKWDGMTLREASEAEVDIVSGATFSSSAIIRSVRITAKSAIE